MKYELIIVGGGPAGISAGIYAVRLNIKVLLITKEFGGQIARKAVAIENYPGFDSISGPELIKKMESHLRSQNIDIELGRVSKIKKKEAGFEVLIENGRKFEALCLILASGAEPKKTGVPGEKEFDNRGVSCCPLCEGPLFKDKTVAIIGGGNAGFETAVFLSKIVKKIYLLEFNSKASAFESIQKIIQQMGKTEVITSAQLKKIKGDNFVKSIIYKDKKTGKEKSLSVQGVFIEAGRRPADSYVQGLVDFNKKGEIKIKKETSETSRPGIFAAGDVGSGPFKQITVAVGEGAKAALSAYGYLQRLKSK